MKMFLIWPKVKQPLKPNGDDFMSLLRVLSHFAWISPACILIALGSFMEEWPEIFAEEIGLALIFFGLLVLCLLQIAYTINTRRYLRLKPYRQEIAALDDYMVQEMEVGQALVSVKPFMKVSCVICSIALAGFVFIFSYGLYEEGRGFVRELLRFRDVRDSIAIWMVFFSYLASTPSIIFNLRTLGMKWINQPGV